MAIQVISKLVQKNNGKFKLMDAKNVSYDGSESVSIKDKVDEVIQKLAANRNIVVSETEPDDLKTGDIWVQCLDK